MRKNPFKPTFGVSPPVLVGREELLEEFQSALDDGPGAQGRATIYTGTRGTGKTVMLNEVQRIAQQNGWLTVAETATTGFVARLAAVSLPAAIERFEGTNKTRLTGVSLPFGAGGATWDRASSTADKDFRSLLEKVTDLLAQNDTGILITLDELHYRQIAELREFGVALQHAFREDRNVAFAGAGLPSAISSVLNDDVLTFLRRADQHVLGPVDLADVERAIREPIERNGRRIEPRACREAARGTDGYPFAIQLVGQYIWREHPEEDTINLDDARAGVTASRNKVGSLVYGPALADLSEGDRAFLVAMAQDDGPSLLSKIAERVGVGTNYASQYRRRLIAAGMVEAAGYGEVDFVQQGLRDYLREQRPFVGAEHLVDEEETPTL